MFDAAIIGGGAVGALTAWELTAYGGAICILEKNADAGGGASRANSAIIHGGFDAAPGSEKARLNIAGNRMMPEVCDILHVPLKKIGSYVLAFGAEREPRLRELFAQGQSNGVEGLEIITGDELRRREPNISGEVTAALYCPSAGIVCPYELAIAAAEAAVSAGAEFFTGFEVRSIRRVVGGFEILSAGGRKIEAKTVVNAAGINADAVALMYGSKYDFTIKPRRGEYVLMDKTAGGAVGSVIFQLPTEKGKGILVTPTVDGNLLVGPNAEDISDKEDNSSTAEGLDEVFRKGLLSVPSLNKRNIITSYAGLRAVSSTGDFIVGRDIGGVYIAAGIESPGLTASPAIAAELAGLIAGDLGLRRIGDKTGRSAPFRFRDANTEERAEMISRNPAYGHIICRCEQVTAGEILDAVRSPAGARTLDAVKRRTRAGMGRCQGGFCMPRVAEILAAELGVPLSEITKDGPGSEILSHKLK